MVLQAGKKINVRDRFLSKSCIYFYLFPYLPNVCAYVNIYFFIFDKFNEVSILNNHIIIHLFHPALSQILFPTFQKYIFKKS